jgi:hypothetical protein
MLYTLRDPRVNVTTSVIAAIEAAISWQAFAISILANYLGDAS